MKYLEDRLENIEKRLAAIEARYKKSTRVPGLEAPISALITTYGPMPMKKLFEKLEYSNVKLKGKRPMNTLSAHVSYLVRNKKLSRDKDGVIHLNETSRRP